MDEAIYKRSGAIIVQVRVLNFKEVTQAADNVQRAIEQLRHTIEQPPLCLKGDYWEEPQGELVLLGLGHLRGATCKAYTEEVAAVIGKPWSVEVRVKRATRIFLPLSF